MDTAKSGFQLFRDRRVYRAAGALALLCLVATAPLMGAESECVVQSVLDCAPDYCGPSNLPVSEHHLFVDPATGAFRGVLHGASFRPKIKVAALEQQQSISTGTGDYPILDDAKKIALFQLATASRFPADSDRHFTLVVVPKNEANDTEVWAGSCPWSGPRPTGAAEGQGSIPARFQGKWNGDPKNCVADDGESRLVIGAKRIEFYESSGPIRAVVTQGQSDVALIAELSGEGYTWLRYMLFRLSNDGKSLTNIESEAPFTWYRCAPEANAAPAKH